MTKRMGWIALGVTVGIAILAVAVALPADRGRNRGDLLGPAEGIRYTEVTVLNVSPVPVEAVITFRSESGSELVKPIVLDPLAEHTERWIPYGQTGAVDIQVQATLPVVVTTTIREVSREVHIQGR